MEPNKLFQNGTILKALNKLNNLRIYSDPIAKRHFLFTVK